MRYLLPIALLLVACGKPAPVVAPAAPAAAQEAVVSAVEDVMPAEFRGVHRHGQREPAAPGGFMSGDRGDYVYEERAIASRINGSRIAYGPITVVRKGGRPVSASWRGRIGTERLTYIPPCFARMEAFNADGMPLQSWTVKIE